MTITSNNASTLVSAVQLILSGTINLLQGVAFGLLTMSLFAIPLVIAYFIFKLFNA